MDLSTRLCLTTPSTQLTLNVSFHFSVLRNNSGKLTGSTEGFDGTRRIMDVKE
jgi:hypothetical protein